MNIDLNDCWLFAGTITERGYGLVHYDDADGAGRSKRAHRVMYEAMVGEIPEDLTIDHLCFVRPCINPEHLEAVTLRENILRSSGVAAVHARKTHCIHGHEFSPENTYHGTRRGHPIRTCKTCLRRRIGEGKAKKLSVIKELFGVKADR